MEIIAGDTEEHALLLACYFLWLEEQNRKNGGSPAEIYLVLSSGESKGSTVSYYISNSSEILLCNQMNLLCFKEFVMRKTLEKGEISFFNACTGIAYSQKDDRCPCRNISCLVSSTVSLQLFPIARYLYLTLDLHNRKSTQIFNVTAHRI